MYLITMTPDEIYGQFLKDTPGIRRFIRAKSGIMLKEMIRKKKASTRFFNYHTVVTRNQYLLMIRINKSGIGHYYTARVSGDRQPHFLFPVWIDDTKLVFHIFNGHLLNRMNTRLCLGLHSTAESLRAYITALPSLAGNVDHSRKDDNLRVWIPQTIRGKHGMSLGFVRAVQSRADNRPDITVIRLNTFISENMYTNLQKKTCEGLNEWLRLESNNDKEYAA